MLVWYLFISYSLVGHTQLSAPTFAYCSLPTAYCLLPLSAAHNLLTLAIVPLVQLKVFITSLKIIRCLHFNQFLKLMLHLFHQIRGGVELYNGYTFAEITFDLKGGQFFNPDTPTVQHIHDPIEDREIIVSSYFQGEILLHDFKCLCLDVPGSYQVSHYWSLVISYW